MHEEVMTHTKYTYRHIVRLTVEAETPIAIGTGKTSDIITDAPVIKDINGLPYIPATSIAGILRDAMALKNNNDGNIFGYLGSDDSGLGSEIIFTDAVMVGNSGEVLDGTHSINWTDDFYKAYQAMPVRQHVRINHKGTAENAGKFDNQVVYKGTRFVFEIELLSDNNNDENFKEAIKQMYDSTLRIGGGTRKGYGKFRVIDCQQAGIDLTNTDDLNKYLAKSSSIAMPWDGFKPMLDNKEHYDTEKWVNYELTLSPLDFFMFGSGMGDADVDNTYVTEKVVKWDNEGKPSFAEAHVLIPGSSVKGALSHRTAYNYNKKCGYYVGNDKAKVGGENLAVATIFGKVGKDGKEIARGNLLISDVIEDDNAMDKVMFHIKIDQFTGGTIDGALFQEKSVYGNGRQYTFEILVKAEALVDDNIREAFERTLKDVCEGILPLGGVTNRGNGIFTGTVTKNGTEL